MAVVFTERHKSDETCLDWLAKENGFLLSVVLKCTLCNRLTPGLSIVADKDSIALDVAIVAILPWQIGETLDGFRLSTVKVNPMRIVSYRDRVPRMPSSAGNNNCKKGRISLTSLLT